MALYLLYWAKHLQEACFLVLYVFDEWEYYCGLKDIEMKKNIFIAGSGVLGTALAQVLSLKDDLNIRLLSIESDVVDCINQKHRNEKYFPLIRLNSSVSATTDSKELAMADVLFICIPSSAVIEFMVANKEIIPADCAIVNMAKGFASEDETLHEAVSKIVHQTLCTMKGPSFARDIIYMQPTAFTFACENKELFKEFKNIFSDTSIHIDYSSDIVGVELLSTLKNIYAIAIGISDAFYDSPNMRFLLLTRAFNEMHQLLIKFGGCSETIFNYCGVGDLGLTALNDLSRNRTLGLLVGKGFYSSTGSVTVEGRVALDIISNKLGDEIEMYPIIGQLKAVFHDGLAPIHFVENILKRI